MKSIKMLGLATFAALMAIAISAASSAMAETTVLCGLDEGVCGNNQIIVHAHGGTLAGAPATLLNSIGNITCDVLSLGSGSGLGAPEAVTGNSTFSNCKRSGTENCTVTEINGPSTGNVLKEGHETAKVTGEGEVKVKCGSFINCTYNGEGLVGTAKGPLLSASANGEVVTSEQTVHKVSGFLCPSEAKLDATIVALAPTYISN
jgi:hypothetical protein